MQTLFLTDLDGTFLAPDAKVSDESAEIINTLTKKGLLFSVATARTYATVIPIFSQVDLRLPLVLMNGVCIYDPVLRKTVFRKTIDSETGRKIVEIYQVVL